MKTSLQTIAIAVLATLLIAPLAADELTREQQEEQQRQEAFRDGFARIVGDINNQDFDRFIEAIDREKMVERIYGLRLIDARIKQTFEENLEDSFPHMVQTGAGFAAAGIVPVRGVPESGLRVRLLGVESRGDRGRAVMRVDLDNYQFDYQEFDLALDSRGNVVVNDWIDYLAGVSFSESIGRYLVLATPSKPALRKLMSGYSASDRELYLFGELMKAARDGNLDKFLELRSELPERIQRLPVVVETAVQLSRAKRKRREMVGALGVMAGYYPDEPRYALMLLDYFFPQKKYEEGITALERLSRELGFPDAAMDARVSAALLAAGKVAEAVERAEAALQREPGLELGWLSALNARNAAADHVGAVAALSHLEREFGYDLGPENLQKSRVFGDLMQSAEYQAWLAARPPKD